MKKYNKYKHSGIEWIGEIPEHWEVKKLKYLGSVFAGLTDKKGDDFSKEYSKNKEPFIPFVNVCNNLKIDENNVQYVKIKPFETQNKLKPNDIIFLMSSETLDDIGKCSIYLGLNEKYYLNSFCKGYRLKKTNIYAEFINYFLQSKAIRDYFSIVGRGFTRINIKQEYIKDLVSVIPPLDEQKAIANFLDKKTAQINKAINQKEKLIKLLKEQKQTIINTAVTKGLNKNAKLTNSGIEWIGEIPEHWEVKKLKFDFIFNKGLTITKENLTSEGICCVNYGEIHSKFGFELNPMIHELKCVSKDYLKENKKSLLDNGDFIFADTSEDIEGSGNFTYLNSNIQTFAGYHTIICKPKYKILSKFFAYIFESLAFRTQIQKKVKGVKVYSITQSILKETFIWSPPKQEQEQIVNYIDKKTSQIDKAINLQTNYIEKLKEYKTSLIDSVVTGKVRVS